MTPQLASQTAAAAPPLGAMQSASAHSPEALSELLQLIGRTRDRNAFARLFEFFAPRLKSFFLRGGAQDAAAEELVQDTLLIVWRKAEMFNAEIAGASTWIYAIARNQRIDRLRRERRSTPLDDRMLDNEPAEEPAGDDVVYAAQAEARLHEAIAVLPPEQVEILHMSFFEHRSHSEIAERLNLPVGTVKSRLRLAFGKLRKSLEDMWE